MNVRPVVWYPLRLVERIFVGGVGWPTLEGRVALAVWTYDIVGAHKHFLLIAEQCRLSELGGGNTVLVVKQRQFLIVSMQDLKPLGLLLVSRRRHVRGRVRLRPGRRRRRRLSGRRRGDQRGLPRRLVGHRNVRALPHSLPAEQRRFGNRNRLVRPGEGLRAQPECHSKHHEENEEAKYRPRVCAETETPLVVVARVRRVHRVHRVLVGHAHFLQARWARRGARQVHFSGGSCRRCRWCAFNVRHRSIRDASFRFAFLCYYYSRFRVDQHPSPSQDRLPDL
mmetsp:Transcript_2450/g.5430  ORF Transcript_2450/g.5430 Transcript_2450/m.5430 type:complete len:281 (-) Transcript_2450:230-1072(-)